jgi:metal-responsive CopG/Arc/MetJ family transcriptional regulator
MATRIINMTIPEELVRQMDEVAKAEGRTRSELVREAARRYVDERKSTARKDSSPLLSRLATLATKGTKLKADKIDRFLYGKEHAK